MNELSWNLDDLAAVQSLKFQKDTFNVPNSSMSELAG